MDTILWLSFVNWDHIYEQRVHHLIRALARRYRIVFIETKMPYLTKLCTLLSNPSRFFNGTCRHYDDNIEILFLYSIFPGIAMKIAPFLYKFNGIFLKGALMRYLRMKNIVHFIIGTSEPFLFSSVISSLGADKIFYDCSDDYLHFKSSGPHAHVIEKSLIQLADIVFVSSRKLLELKSRLAPRMMHYLPNAVDYARFQEYLMTERKILWETKPVVGYVGHIAEWIDFDLIAHLLRSNPNLFFVFIGMVEGNVRTVFSSLQRRFENIINIPPQPYNRIAVYINSFNVAIIPFRRTPIVEAVDPLKLYEYAACGKPIVSTYWNELEPHRGMIYLASSKNQFSDYLRIAIHSQQTAKLKTFAMENTWQKRAECLENLLQATISL